MGFTLLVDLQEVKFVVVLVQQLSNLSYSSHFFVPGKVSVSFALQLIEGAIIKASQTRRPGLCCWGSVHPPALEGIAKELTLIKLLLEQTNKQTYIRETLLI